ncbi:unnamed protein product [Pseudo-nitzschia multistriata]|uniref:Uncharacterized protein n=1 Tax=Pseudo-nitzschia multistriata TaxID=183589 RepID=A0A448ZPG2_9STRA|nr:unnamed protein product [Pseudo-nitzschia multistriata]
MDGRSRAGNVKEDVEDGENANENSGQSSGREKGVLLPGLGVAILEHTSRNIAGHGSRGHIQQNDGGQHLALLHWADQSNDGEHHGEEASESDLCTGAHQNAEKHRAGSRGPEDVAMDQFPSGFFPRFFELLHLVVSSDISSQSSDHNGGDCSRQEKDDHKGVDNGKRVNIVVRASDEVNIPPVGPGKSRFFPFYFVRINDGEKTFGTGLLVKSQVRFQIVLDGRCIVGIASRNFLGHGNEGVLLLNFVPDTDRVHIESCNVQFAGVHLLVGDGKFQVIVEIKLFHLQSCVAWRSLETNGKASNRIVVIFASHEDRKTIKGHVNSVLAFDQLSQKSDPPGGDHLLAQGSAAIVLLYLHGVWSGLELQALQTGAEVLALSSPARDGHFGHGTAGQLVKIVGNLGLPAVYVVRVHQDFFTSNVWFRGRSRKEDGRQVRLALSKDPPPHLLSQLVLSHCGCLRCVSDFVLARRTEFCVTFRFLLPQSHSLFAAHSLGMEPSSVDRIRRSLGRSNQSKQEAQEKNAATAAWYGRKSIHCPG